MNRGLGNDVLQSRCIIPTSPLPHHCLPAVLPTNIASGPRLSAICVCLLRYLNAEFIIISIIIPTVERSGGHGAQVAPGGQQCSSIMIVLTEVQYSLPCQHLYVPMGAATQCDMQPEQHAELRTGPQIIK